MVPKHFLPAFYKKEEYMMVIWPTLHTNRRVKTMHTRDVVLTKMCGNAPKTSHIKTASIYFKAKHEKGVGTSFPLHYTPDAHPPYPRF